MSADESTSVKLDLNRIGLAIGIIAGLAGALGAWYLLPYRVDAIEKRTAVVETKLDAQQQLLIRIDENVKLLRRGERRSDPSSP